MSAPPPSTPAADARCSGSPRARSSRRAPAGGERSSARSSTCRRPGPRLLPERLRRSEPPRLPEVSEPEIVRHYVGLSKRNFDLDSGFYPLGSCTMKHNPRLHERAAALPGHARLHPLQDAERAQGALELMWNLQRALAEIAGLPHVTPAALGGLPRRARGRAAHARLPRGSRRAPPQGAHARHRPRHQPGDRDDGGPRGRQGRHRRARRRRPRRPAREGRRATSPA